MVLHTYQLSVCGSRTTEITRRIGVLTGFVYRSLSNNITDVGTYVKYPDRFRTAFIPTTGLVLLLTCRQLAPPGLAIYDS